MRFTMPGLNRDVQTGQVRDEVSEVRPQCGQVWRGPGKRCFFGGG